MIGAPALDICREKSCIMSSTTGIAMVLSDGHIALPKKMREALGLRKGCRLELTIHRVWRAPEDVEAALLTAVHNPDTSVEQLATLVQELTSCVAPSPHLLQDLEAIARAQMPKTKQQRLHRLLSKQAQGMITPQERKTLEDLVTEGQRWNLSKGAAALVLKWLGTDLFPDLTQPAPG
jgi:bifunctional DNA-binding transcriptional regulator/antitoxin component of YhaV-PrlF toxin-antitoxin module